MRVTAAERLPLAQEDSATLREGEGVLDGSSPGGAGDAAGEGERVALGEGVPVTKRGTSVPLTVWETDGDTVMVYVALPL